MRVIAGEAKGRKLKSPTGKTRPLSDQVKEALFNILQTRIEDCSFLDLFAGSGGVGIEALSRGALLSIFVELDRRTAQTIRENLSLCGFENKAEVYVLDVLQALKLLKRQQAKFDIIFLGAPYGSPSLEKALEVLAEGDLLKEKSLVIAEHRKQHVLSSVYGKLNAVREAKYGETVLTFYENSSLPGEF